MTSNSPTWDAVVFILQAYGVVIIISFLCATVIWGIVAGLGYLQQLQETRAAEAAAAKRAASTPAAAVPASAAAAAPAAPVAEGDIPEDHLAVIAAVCAVIGAQPVRIHIDRSKQMGGWVIGGRSALLRSHGQRARR
ncbi:MAG: hypothetical protein LBR29_04035 [Methylobacteriaceae bacterium]|jgi:hypothetical protein|nr:hypothetical protein [Methylobacteriaceae bacterium]